MAVALPSPETVLLEPPGPEETGLLARGIVSAVRPADGLSPLQVLLLEAIFTSMTGRAVNPATAEPIEAGEFAVGLARRNLEFRTRIVQIMLLAEFVLAPIPREIAERVAAFADELGVADDMITVAEAYATGALDLAAADFARNGYLSAVDPGRLRAVHAAALANAWGAVVDDAGLASRWQSLAELPVETLGRGVFDFYRDRGFVFPGLPGSAPPLLAQHDWAHVLSGYGTTLESELEVFAFMARSNDDPRAFSLLAMVVSLFETGYLAAGAGLFQADPGHLRSPGVAVRLADAMRRGALTTGSHDFLEIDWFTLADRPVQVVRTEIGLVDKADAAVLTGSAGPWQPGGITAYQLDAARAQAATEGRDYRPWIPDPTRV